MVPGPVPAATPMKSSDCDTRATNSQVGLEARLQTAVATAPSGEGQLGVVGLGRAAPFDSGVVTAGIDAAQVHGVDAVLGALDQDQLGPDPGGQDVLAQVAAVDRRPDGAGGVLRLVVGRARRSGGSRTADPGTRSPAAQEALDVPRLDVGARRRRRRSRSRRSRTRRAASRRPPPAAPAARSAPRRSRCRAAAPSAPRPARCRSASANRPAPAPRRRAGLDVGQEAHQRGAVVALGKALALHQPALFEHAHWGAGSRRS